jgi:hypothetical protein
MADPISVMNLLEALEWPTKLGCHDLDVFGDVAVLTSVRMLRLKDQDITPVHMPAVSLTKGRERAVI